MRLDKNDNQITFEGGEHMGEKTGGLTNTIIVLVALVAVVLIVRELFPEFTQTIMDGMGSIIDGEVDQLPYDGSGSGE